MPQDPERGRRGEGRPRGTWGPPTADSQTATWFSLVYMCPVFSSPGFFVAKKFKNVLNSTTCFMAPLATQKSHLEERLQLPACDAAPAPSFPARLP